jgi:mannose-6-phosphate isomerase-like protein (cupin superfamily)
MADLEESRKSGRFDVMALARTLPETASTMLADIYLSDREAASARIFRVYRPLPAHYHETCHEHLYILSGRAMAWIGDETKVDEVGPGQLLVFEKKTVHAIPEILEEPFLVLSFDTPRRQPKDIVFVDPKDGTAANFMARNAET